MAPNPLIAAVSEKVNNKYITIKSEVTGMQQITDNIQLQRESSTVISKRNNCMLFL